MSVQRTRRVNADGKNKSAAASGALIRDDGVLDLDSSLAFQIIRVEMQFRAYFSAMVDQSVGLDITEWRVMMAIACYSGSSARDVAHAFGIMPMTVSRVLGRLARAGLVRRRVNPADRRKEQLELTAAGRAVYKKIRPIASELELRLLAAFTASELAAGRRMLDRIRLEMQQVLVDTGAQRG